MNAGLPTAGRPAAPDTVFFLSDYGLRDEFVGVVHAVLRRLAPPAVVVDLTHEVPPFDVRAGAATLRRAWPHLGNGVVLAVVDPGVGGGRRGLALEVASTGGPRFLVGPDNGLLVPVAEAAGTVAAVELGVPAPDAAATFDGRDVFAPAAAALCRGAAVADLGPAVDPAGLERVPPPVVEPGTLPDGRHCLRVEVSWVDRFGNVQLATTAEALPSEVPVVVVRPDAGPWAVVVGADFAGDEPVPRVRTFTDLEPGSPGLLADGNGQLALVVGQGSAAAHFGLGPGSLVQLMW
ncbi:MAG: SAM hydrolase/SAM-dependent halogenase family protein [Acidimicrobiales bacterium]